MVDHIDHQTFLMLQKQGKARISVDGTVALKLVASLPRRYRFAIDLWSWVWFLMFPGALIVGFCTSWWVGLGIFLFAGPVRQAIKKSAVDFVFEFATENERFFNECVAKGLLTIQIQR